MIRNKTGQAAATPLIPDPTPTIKRMKPSNRQARRVTDIMEIRRSHQQIPVLWRNHDSNTPRTRRYLLNMQPAIPQWGQEPFSSGLGPRCQQHAGTLPRIQPATPTLRTITGQMIAAGGSTPVHGPGLR